MKWESEEVRHANYGQRGFYCSILDFYARLWKDSGNKKWYVNIFEGGGESITTVPEEGFECNDEEIAKDLARTHLKAYFLKVMIELSKL